MTIVVRADGCNGTPTKCATLRHTWSDEGLDCHLGVSPKEEKDLENRHKNDEQSVRVDDQMLENTYRRIMAASATCTSDKPGEFDTSSISSCTDSSTASPSIPFGGACYNYYPSKNKGRPVMNLELVLAMERTLFAALNNAWLLTLGGVGLMSVGVEAATRIGTVVLVGGITAAVAAFITHWARFRCLAQNKSFRASSSVLFVAVFFLLTIATLVLELFYGVQYPYLERAQKVAMSSVDGIEIIPPQINP
eukprot:CAMPEP_0185815294 /NCGR_PEP_ID=MMETSP1322-20130828/15502_1 /TAXON_ID=265543 /ORGANISM="Minutocellus polymorphus, Strain RCC2270" /LENGTH=249 /DNA_ID=CAMNT_0028512155 /DNA_START=84 /DNA_END=833 /DNA_ORIENTATION=-